MELVVECRQPQPREESMNKRKGRKSSFIGSHQHSGERYAATLSAAMQRIGR